MQRNASDTYSFNGNGISLTTTIFLLYYAMQNYLVVYKESSGLFKMLRHSYLPCFLTHQCCNFFSYYDTADSCIRAALAKQIEK